MTGLGGLDERHCRRNFSVKSVVSAIADVLARARPASRKQGCTSLLPSRSVKVRARGARRVPGQ